MPALYATSIKSLPLLSKGKVRDVYALGDDKLLMVTTDRLSAFDVVMGQPIPEKGIVLNQMANFWFEKLAKVIPNHLTGIDPESVVTVDELDQVKGRAVVAKRLKPILVEAVVRGYLAGSGWKDYQETGKVCGITLPPGLENAQKLPEPIFTPAFKAELGEKDENITFERVVELIGSDNADALKKLSLDIFGRASELASKAGLILADTKFEFGINPANGEITLGDEVLTPDSSRYWSQEAWDSGDRKDSFDKQQVRNWLAANWDPASGTNPPELPTEIVDQTSAKYAQLISLLAR